MCARLSMFRNIVINKRVNIGLLITSNNVHQYNVSCSYSHYWLSYDEYCFLLSVIHEWFRRSRYGK